MRAAAVHPARSTPWSAVAFLAPLSILTVIALVLGNGSLDLALLPLISAALFCMMWKAPLRVSVLLLMFFGLVLENPDDNPAEGAWRSPLYTLGAIMLAHLNATTGIKPLFFSGLDLVIAFLFLVMVHRKLTHSRIDGDRLPAASPVRSFAWLSLAGVFAWWIYGVASGGSFSNSLWQVNKLYYLPVAFLLFEAAFRDPEDYRPLGLVLLLAACVKASFALWVRLVVTDVEIAYATTHRDSILFACALSLIVALFIESRGRQTLYLFVLPLILAGMIANNRRLAWVEAALALGGLYLITPWTARKRTFARVVLLTLPLVAAYLAAGWTSRSPVFAPARLVRSVVSSESDGSSRWRDWENFNLVYSTVQNPMLGTGFGYEYLEVWPLPSISSGFPMYRYLPHNGVLGLWASCGYLGFAVQWLLLVVGIFFATRTYRHALRSVDRAAALSSASAILIYMVAAYGDTNLGSWSGVFTVAPALAASGKLAIATGAWPARRKNPIALRADNLS